MCYLAMISIIDLSDRVIITKLTSHFLTFKTNMDVHLDILPGTSHYLYMSQVRKMLDVLLPGIGKPLKCQRYHRHHTPKDWKARVMQKYKRSV